MPTIQVRTDDQTKTASTALFDQLGITMSEAINLFLRQAVMQGGIPFTLTVPEVNLDLQPRRKVSERQKNEIELLENEALIDALKRYKSVNGKSNFDMTKADSFLQAVEAIDSGKDIRITLQEKAAKVRLNFKGSDYVLDYNFEEPDSVFILSRRRDGKLIVKDCPLAGIYETLEHF